MSLQENKGAGGKEERRKKTSLEGGNASYDRAIRILAVMVLIVFGAYAYLSLTGGKDPSQGQYAYEEEILGIAVNSEFPLDSLQNFKTIALFDSSDSAVISCNYELSAVSSLSSKGYAVIIERNSPGIYITREGAWIRGRNNQEILSACTAFTCLREGIVCSDDLLRVPGILSGRDTLNLVIDTGLGEKSFQGGIIAVGYALGVIQSQTNADMTTWLRNNNRCFIATILNESGLHKPNVTENVSCDSLDGVHMLYSGRGEILIEGSRITLQGSDEQVYAGAVIIQNIIAPDLRERLKDLNIAS